MSRGACSRATVSGSRAAIYLSMGPSGAGKDTLLMGARQKLEDEHESAPDAPRVAFLRRLVTREPHQCTDLEISVSEREFQESADADMYALSWWAHGTSYAIARDELERGLADRKRLVLNVSRTVVDRVIKEYSVGRGVDVFCLHITCSDPTLISRLMARGREPLEQIHARLERARRLVPSGPHVLTIYNESSVDDGVRRVLHALRYGESLSEDP